MEGGKRSKSRPGQQRKNLQPAAIRRGAARIQSKEEKGKLHSGESGAQFFALGNPVAVGCVLNDQTFSAAQNGS